jgi:hypothetical protein
MKYEHPSMGNKIRLMEKRVLAVLFSSPEEFSFRVLHGRAVITDERVHRVVW